MKHLWSHIIDSATEGVRCPVEEDLCDAHAEIRESDVTLIIQQHVVQLQISVPRTKITLYIIKHISMHLLNINT